jgi:gamma-glutamyl-gamma-aminobutyrate hydrolase PuuD
VANASPSLRIGVFGTDPSSPNERHGCKLWAAGLTASLTAAEAIAVPLVKKPGRSWDQLLSGLHGVVLSGHDGAPVRQEAAAEDLCNWCREHELPLLGIDHGLHLLNTANGGTVYGDLPREVPEALQHRHPPERGLRHAINVVDGTRLAELYGEGEGVVNSEHRRAVWRVARGFRVGARALDGIIEAIECEEENWFALGVQWQPASATASGLDIQVFRGLVEACRQRAAHGDLVECAA